MYGDTDSVFCHLPGLTLQQAAAFGEAVSAHFAERVLPYPQKLEFEKILFPLLLYRKKMYCGMKFENYGEEARGKTLSKGIALVRRDNSKLVRAAMKETLECALRANALASEAVAVAARHIALMEASVRSMHEARRPADHLPIEAFVLSAGISKDLDAYAGPANSAAMVARRLMEINPLEKIGSGARVTFVIAATSAGARRAEQAELVSDLLREKKRLDACYYADAIRAKCEPLLSALFIKEELSRATVRSATGELVVVAPKRQSDRSKLPGEMEAARRLAEAVEAARRARAASEPRAEKRKVNAFDMMKAGAAAASKKRK